MSYSLLKATLEQLDSKNGSGGWINCFLPEHNAGNACLSWFCQENGKLVVKTWGDWGIEQALDELGGFRMADLYPPKERHGLSSVPKYYTVEGERRTLTNVYEYRSEIGETLFIVGRTEQKDFPVWQYSDGVYRIGMKGARRVIYNLDRVINSPTATIVFVEGEKDAENGAKALSDYKIVFTTLPGGCNKSSKTIAPYLESIAGRNVVVIPDHDKIGIKYGKILASALLNAGAKMVKLCLIPDLTGDKGKKDLSDWFGMGFQARDMLDIIKKTNLYVKSNMELVDNNYVKANLPPIDKLLQLEELFSAVINVPIENGLPKVYESLFRIESEHGTRLEPLFNDNKKINNPILRCIAAKIISEGAGQSVATRNSRIIAENIAHRVERGLGGVLTVVNNSPYFDKGLKRFVVNSSEKDNAIIYRTTTNGEKYIVKNNPEALFNEENFANFIRCLGDEWGAIVSFMITCLVNITPGKKVGLAIVGGAMGGKTTKAQLIMQGVQGHSVVISGSGVAGGWPLLINNRVALIDNLDNKSLPVQDVDLLCAGMTAENVTYPARYSKMGVSGELCYPLVTSTNIDVFSWYPALETRFIQIIHNPESEIKKLMDKNAVRIANDFRPSLYWLCEQFMEWYEGGKAPRETPGGLRYVGYAYARFWVAENLECKPRETAFLICQNMRSDATPSNDFIDLLNECLSCEGDTIETNPVDLAKLLQSVPDWERVNQLARSKNIPITIGLLLRKYLTGGRIGNYSLRISKIGGRRIQYRFQEVNNGA